MSRFSRWLEIATNVAIIGLVLVFGTMLIRGSFRKNAAPQADDISAGQTISLPVSQSGKKSVVLAISTQCHFCTESAPFYRTLMTEVKKANRQLIAVLPQDVEEAQAYLGGEGVRADEVLKGSFAKLKVSGTPTLMLVNEKNKVTHVWKGKLSPSQEKEVISHLKES